MRFQHLLTAFVVLWTAVPSALPAGPAEAAAGSAPVVEALRVRHFTHGDRTRVVVDLSDMVPYQVRRVAAPERIVLELPGVSHASTATVAIEDSRVRRVRRNALPDRTQVVLDLTGRKQFRAFEIPAKNGIPARIVVDVFPEEDVPVKTAISIPASPPVAAPGSAVAPAGRPSGRAQLSSGSDSPPSKGAAKVIPPPVPRSAASVAQADPYVVVIDPGHGGSDAGTAGCGVVHEKRVTLGIARRMKQALESQPGVRVVLTRDRDVAVPLDRRVALAENAGGDLFISIHANSAPRSSARGAEVYFLSRRGASSATAAELANRENAAHTVGLEPSRAGDDDLISILMDLKGSAILQRSGLLAEIALGEVARTDVTNSRAVKQANFLVLRTLSMPAILVEAGFLSNRSEAKRLKSAEGQKRIGEALAGAVLLYLDRYGEKKKLPMVAAARTHTVRRGDTLWDLATSYRTSVKALRVANNLNGTRLRVGQRLILP